MLIRTRKHFGVLSPDYRFLPQISSHHRSLMRSHRDIGAGGIARNTEGLYWQRSLFLPLPPLWWWEWHSCLYYLQIHLVFSLDSDTILENSGSSSAPNFWSKSLFEWPRQKTWIKLREEYHQSGIGSIHSLPSSFNRFFHISTDFGSCAQQAISNDLKSKTNMKFFSP